MLPHGDRVATRARIVPRALVWVAATLPLQELGGLGSRRAAGETMPMVYACLIALAWLECARGSCNENRGARRYWILPRGELFVHATVLALLTVLATHAPRWGTPLELLLGVALLAAISWLASAAYPRIADLSEGVRRVTQVGLASCLAAGSYYFAAFIRPSDNQLLSATLFAIAMVALPGLLACGLGLLLSRTAGFTWKGDLATRDGLQVSTRVGHAAVAALLLMYFHSLWIALLALPLILLLFGTFGMQPVEPDTSPKEWARLSLPFALPLVAAACIHLVDPPITTNGIAASHAEVGVFFAALVPVLPAMVLAMAAVLDKARRVREVRGVGGAALAFLFALVLIAPRMQVALAHLFGRELQSADGVVEWLGLPFGDAHRTQAFAGLALVAWASVRSWRFFRKELQPGLLPPVGACLVTIVAALFSVPLDGAAGAAHAVVVGSLAGLLLELPGTGPIPTEQELTRELAS